MRPAHVATSHRLLRWFLRLVVRKNRNVSNTQPLNEPATWTPALMFLQGIISFRPMTHLYSTKEATNYITQVCEVKSCSDQLICIEVFCWNDPPSPILFYINQCNHNRSGIKPHLSISAKLILRKDPLLPGLEKFPPKAMTTTTTTTTITTTTTR